jgi:retron-type reverse transcriptase
MDTYKPDPYVSFYVEDPKLRHIHKATVRDRVLHQAVFSVLYGVFDKHFIFDSYSSRNYKGTHKGNERAELFLSKATANWTRQAWCLKCDVRKFFDSIDHEILFSLIGKKISDERTIRLVEIILKSFEKSVGKGLPLGNVTSQLFANIYMNEFDQFMKHTLKARLYARYCDDFVIVDRNKNVLKIYISEIRQFLLEKLKLDLHPNKVSIRKARQGIDFLGYVVLPHRKVVRLKTKRRILRKIVETQKQFKIGNLTKETFKQITASYKGVLSHGKNKRVELFINNMIKIK